MKKKAAAPTPPKKILILHEEGNSFNNPSLKCIIDLLLEKGCEIDLRYSCRHAQMPCVIGIRFLPFGNVLRKFKAFAFNILCFKPLIILSVLTEKLFLYKRYDLIVGVDRLGLIEASILHKITGTPYIFISFEICFSSETSERFKLIEKEASKDVSLWIVQDETRAQLLQIENDLHPAIVFLLPLSSANIGIVKTDRLRDRLGIPPEKQVAISIGSVSAWTMTHQILQSVAAWPEDWVLVIHERYGRTSVLLKDDISLFDELVGHKIFISDAATTVVDDLGSVLAGVSIGLALYNPDSRLGIYGGKNIQFLGLSSGKISAYLRYGVPVIVNNIGIYTDETLRYRFGCVIDRPEQIADCLLEVLQEEYQRNARNYFSDKLDFNNYREELWLRFQSILN